jgi:hypothetical protein
MRAYIDGAGDRAQMIETAEREGGDLGIMRRLVEFDQVFGSLQRSFGEVLEAYDDEQLATIVDFLTRSVQHSREVIATLGQDMKAAQATEHSHNEE